MSSYRHITAIRWKPLESFYTRLNIESLYDLEDKFPNLVGRNKIFQPAIVNGGTEYLDLVLTEDTDRCGEFYKSRNVTDPEYRMVIELTDKFRYGDTDWPDRFRYVDYCWYDYSEPEDCFDDTRDPFYQDKAAQIFDKIVKYNSDNSKGE